jgi:LEA14-like dessication related protein
LRRKSLILLLTLIVAASMSAVAYQQLLQPSVTPRVVGLRLSWGTITDAATQVNVDVTVYNPSPAPIRGSIEELVIYFNGIRLAWSDRPILVELRARANSTVTATLIVDNSKLGAAFVSHLQHHESSTATISMKLTVLRLPLEVQFQVETNILGEANRQITEKLDG